MFILYDNVDVWWLKNIKHSVLTLAKRKIDYFMYLYIQSDEIELSIVGHHS